MKSRVTGMNRSGLSEAVKAASRMVRLQANHVSRTNVARYGTRDLSLVENRYCANLAFRGEVHLRRTYQSPSYGSAFKGNPSNDHAQFTVTVTAVVAMIVPLAPVTVTV
jgi:hypothetical protein